MSCKRSQTGRALALFVALAATIPASVALANDAPENAAVLAGLEESCDECVDPEAVEEIVDEGVAPAEMHPMTSAEALVADEDGEETEAPADADDQPSDDAPKSSQDDRPLDDPISPFAPLHGSPTSNPCAMSAGSFSMPAPTMSPVLTVGTIDFQELARPLDPSPSAVLGATHAVSPVIVWLRTCTRAHASDDDHASNR